MARWSLLSVMVMVLLSGVWLPNVRGDELDEQMSAFGIFRFTEDIDAPDFSITTTDGKTIRLSDLKGHPILLNFWATW